MMNPSDPHTTRKYSINVRAHGKIKLDANNSMLCTVATWKNPLNFLVYFLCTHGSGLLRIFKSRGTDWHL